MEMWKRCVTPMSIFNTGKFQKQYEQAKTEETKEEIKVIPERTKNEQRIKIEQLSLFS